MNDTVTRTASVPIANIAIGNRRREEYGDIPALARSIKRHGLLQPIGLSDDLKLVFGGRRLRAIELLGKTNVEATLLGYLTDEQISEMELAENDNRDDLTEYEKARTFLAEVQETASLIVAKAAEEVSSNLDETSNKGGRPSAYGVPKKELADAHGTSKTELIRTEKYVEVADAFPVFQQPQWKSYQVLEAREHLGKLPEPARAEAVSLIDQPAIVPKRALGILESLTKMSEPEREEVLTLQHSTDPRDRDAAITRTAGEQPMPDARLTILASVIRDLKKARDLMNDDFRQDIAGLVSDVGSVREALKSADTERMEGERGKLHTTAA